jgi:hypothetical protein
MLLRLSTAIACATALVSCSDVALSDADDADSSVEAERIDFYGDLEQVYKRSTNRWSRPYALMKVSSAGEDWLLTVHGLSDNEAACEEIAEPYNAKPSLSTLPGDYVCVAIDENFSYNATL